MFFLVEQLRNYLGGCVTPRFDWDINNMGDLTGKVAVVTGVTVGGIGYEVAKGLTARGAGVYLACRDSSRADEAIRMIHAELEVEPKFKGRLTSITMDLVHLKSCNKASELIIERETRLDFIIANAGIMAVPYRNIHGIEQQFYNHLGHYAFIVPLLPLLTKTALSEPTGKTRIVILTSNTHVTSPRPDFTSASSVSRPLSSTFARYAQSKLCNLLLVNSLSRLLPSSIKVLGVHPGPVATSLFRGTEEMWPLFAWLVWVVTRLIIPWTLLSPREGAKTVLFAATAGKEWVGPSGGYIIPFSSRGKASAMAKDNGLADELWKLSQELVVKRLAEPTSPAPAQIYF